MDALGFCVNCNTITHCREKIVYLNPTYGFDRNTTTSQPTSYRVAVCTRCGIEAASFLEPDVMAVLRLAGKGPAIELARTKAITPRVRQALRNSNG